MVDHVPLMYFHIHPGGSLINRHLYPITCRCFHTCVSPPKKTHVLHISVIVHHHLHPLKESNKKKQSTKMFQPTTCFQISPPHLSAEGTFAQVASKGLSFGTFSAGGKNSGHVVSGETCWWLCCFRGFGLPQQVFEVWGLDVKHQVVHCRQTSKTWLERDFRALGICRALSHKRPRLGKPTNLLKKGSVSSVRLTGYQPQQLCRIETSSNTHIENWSFGHNHQKNRKKHNQNSRSLHILTCIQGKAKKIASNWKSFQNQKRNKPKVQSTTEMAFPPTNLGWRFGKPKKFTWCSIRTTCDSVSRESWVLDVPS